MKAGPTLTLIAGLLAGAAHTHAEAPCLRADDPIVANLVTRGLGASDTFRRLYQRLEDSNLIVHVRRGTRLPAGSGYNQFITYAGSYRFLRITLNVDRVNDDAVALLGHELRHAVELAEAPAVDDDGDYQRLYDRIGYLSCARAVPRCYETQAAVMAGRDVLRELRNKPIGVAPAISAVHLLRRWLAQAGPWSAEAGQMP
jgi:hypothetical protein